jgi:hypothetical protein
MAWFTFNENGTSSAWLNRSYVYQTSFDAGMAVANGTIPNGATSTVLTRSGRMTGPRTLSRSPFPASTVEHLREGCNDDVPLQFLAPWHVGRRIG